jgi:osmoprotectant transport system ATP-binding protein
MDEPFGAIDAITRSSLQEEILRLHRQLQKTTLFVSHDVEEALKLADKILILQQGEILQYDTPWHILTEPANAFVKELVGAEDIVRQLSLLRVSACMTPLSLRAEGAGFYPVFNAALPTIAPDDHLRHALALLIGTGADSLQVVDRSMDAAALVGTIALKDITNFAQIRK